MKSALITAVAAALPFAALAHDYTVGSIKVAHPYAFETPRAAMSGGGFMSITNAGDEDDVLLGVKADFPKVEIHLSEEKDGMATMTHQESLAIPAGETVDLAPGGYHVMFMGLNGDSFEVDEKIPATLVFEKAGEVDVTFNVEPRGEMKGMDQPGMNHSGHGSH